MTFIRKFIRIKNYIKSYWGWWDGDTIVRIRKGDTVTLMFLKI